MAFNKLAALAALAMLAFAANSLLARAALLTTGIDPATFSAVRLISGAIFLLLCAAWRTRRIPLQAGNWGSAAALFTYAVAFSFAYVSLSTGAGALILFGSVQIAMLCYGLSRGNRLTGLQWAGFTLACAGVVYLLLPGLHAPPLVGAALMALAGIGWAVYTLSAGDGDPVLASAGNFARTIPMCLVLVWLLADQSSIDSMGVAYALASGVLTSGLGYVIWYAVLPQLGVVNAATIQLSVPALAAVMGIVLLGEALSVRLVVATIATVIGIASVLHFGEPNQRGIQSARPAKNEDAIKTQEEQV